MIIILLVVDTHKWVQYNSNIARKYIAHMHCGVFAWVQIYASDIFFLCVVQIMSCSLRMACTVTSPGQVRSTHCGLLGVSLLTRTHLVQVLKYTHAVIFLWCKLFKEDTHTVAWWVSPTVQLQDTSLCGANWICKLKNVYTVTSQGQVQSSHALLFCGITLERSNFQRWSQKNMLKLNSLRKGCGSSGMPWSGQSMYCRWVISRDCRGGTLYGTWAK